MKRCFFTFLFSFSFLGFSQDMNIDMEDHLFAAYLRNFAPVAVSEMHRTGIPASIKLVQGILESYFGMSFLAKGSNNHFGIKCKRDWNGARFFYSDDEPNECFRKYDSVLESFFDHSRFLTTKKRYSSLFLLDKKDYKGWALGLQKAGYATDLTYPEQLIKRIEKYRLWVFDEEQLEGLSQRIEQYLLDLDLKLDVLPSFDFKHISKKKRVFRHINKKKKYIIVGEGENIEEIAKRYKISLHKLRLYNDLDGDKSLSVGQNLFLQGKNAYGISKFYVVKKGETMHSISQKLGVKLKKLYYKNSMKEDQEPIEGQVLYIKGRKR